MKHWNMQFAFHKYTVLYHDCSVETVHTVMYLVVQLHYCTFLKTLDIENDAVKQTSKNPHKVHFMLDKCRLKWQGSN